MVNKILFYELIFVGVIILYNILAVTIQTNKKNNRIRLSNKKNENDMDNPYVGLRKMAFDMSFQQLGLTLNDSDIYGVILDWDIGDGIVTLVAYKTGDASLYFSSGGGVIGGGQNHYICSAAKKFVKEATVYFNESKVIYATPLPDKNSIRFYFLTAKGKHCIHEQLKNIRNKTSAYYDYFGIANDLITELRKTIKEE
jgi:hypothetical protein